MEMPIPWDAQHGQQLLQSGADEHRRQAVCAVAGCKPLATRQILSGSQKSGH